MEPPDSPAVVEVGWDTGTIMQVPAEKYVQLKIAAGLQQSVLY